MTTRQFAHFIYFLILMLILMLIPIRLIFRSLSVSDRIAAGSSTWT